MALCGLCGRRKARRACPALGREICTICCATKRIVEIACPSECVYLTSAREHPPAIVQRQRTRDIAFIVTTWTGLTELQSRLALVLQRVVHAHRAGAVPRLLDRDVEEAAATFARTLETASRGVIYEHQASSLPAQRLVQDLKKALEALEQETRRSIGRDVVPALRSLERGAAGAARALDGSETAFLDLIARAMTEQTADAASAPTEEEAPRIVFP